MHHSYTLLPLLSLASACQKDHSLFKRRGLYKRQGTSSPPPLSAEESTLLSSFDNNTISDWSYYYTHGLHVAGTNQSMAQWTADKWSGFGIPSSLASYDVYLNYPVSHSLSLDYGNGSTFTASLTEDELVVDEVTTYPNRVPTFHGYSASGSATAEYVYVGRGQQVDFERLQDLGVPLEGKIALAKYGGPFRGLKVKNAQSYGMIGCVIFTDPGDDGNITEANGYAAYPDGPARQPSSVQRGSVQFLSTYPGDPTTPGYPSKEGSPRADTSEVTPQIPSLPISWVEAVPLLAALDGYGTPGDVVNGTDWVGTLNVTYSTGPAPGVTISMMNEMRDTITPIWDAIGIINGTSEDEVIIIGNHRDAWIIGGAADPNSGSAIMVEMAKALGKLVAAGWKPKRTIILASWDSEEYGLLGSTEWMEEYIPWLTNAAVAYLNIDVGCSGPRPDLSATPELHTLALDLMKKVLFPSYTDAAGIFYEFETLYDAWYNETEGEVGVLGSGSDYTSFLHRGIGSLDIGATNGATDPVYHYHSDYDTYHWMISYGDPEFKVHKTIGQYLTLLTYHLSSDELLAFDIPNYTTQMRLYLDELNLVINSTDGASVVDLSELEDAIDTFDSSASQVVALTTLATSMNSSALIDVVNHKLRDFQRGFTSQGGLPNREFYRHVIFAPGIDTGYAPVTYPGITEAVEAGNMTLAQEWVGKTAEGIRVAAGILKT